MAGKKGAPLKNTNAMKHGKYSKHDLLQCNRCMAKDLCVEYKAGATCAFERPLRKPDIGNVEKLLEQLRELLSQDLLRAKRAFLFERLNSVLDVDTLKLEANITKLAEVISRLEVVKLEIFRREQELENFSPPPLVVDAKPVEDSHIAELKARLWEKMGKVEEEIALEETAPPKALALKAP